MRKVIRYTFTASAFAVLAACGGGGGGGSGGGGGGGSLPTAIFYRNFDLSNSVLSSMLQTCNASASQIQIRSFTYDPATQIYTNYTFVVDGDLRLPNANSCSTAGMTGNVTSVRMSIDGSVAYVMTGLNIDANSLTSGWQFFWRDVNSTSSSIQASSPNASTSIICRDSGNVLRTLNMTNSGNIKDFITACTR